MRQQEYNELHDIKRDLMLFVAVIVGIMVLFVISADAAESKECISWKWIQTGSHTECSGWFCWTVPEYSIVCTEYAQEDNPTIMPGKIIKTDDRPTSIGFAYTFGRNDVERYQIQKNISDMRAIYIMQNIAFDNGLTTEQFEKKYNIKVK